MLGEGATLEAELALTLGTWAILEATLGLAMLEALLEAEGALKLTLVPEVWAALETELAWGVLETLAEGGIVLESAFGLEIEAALEEGLALATPEAAEEGTLGVEAALVVLDPAANLLLAGRPALLAGPPEPLDVPTIDVETTLDVGATTEELALAVLLAAADEATLEGLA